MSAESQPVELKSSPAKNAVLANRIQSVVFFVIFFCAVFNWIEPQLVYHGGGLITNFPVFYFGSDFLQTYVTRPGGVIHYLSDFLIQCLYNRSLGSALLTFQAIALFLGSRMVFQSLNLASLRFVSYALPFLLLSIYVQYGYFVNTFTQVNFLITGFVFFGCLRFSKTMHPVLLAILILPVTFLLFLGAGLSVFVLALLCFLNELGELRRRSRIIPMVGWIIALVLTPWIYEWWRGDLVSSEALSRYTSFLPKSADFKNSKMVMLHGLCWLVPFCGLGALAVRGLYSKFMHPKKWVSSADSSLEKPSPLVEKGKSKKSSSQVVKESWFREYQYQLGYMATSVVLLVGYVIILKFCHNQSLKKLMQVDYYVYHQQWQKVLDHVPADESSPYLLCAANQALAHLGRLGDELSFNQGPDTFLLYHGRYQADWNVIDVYLDLGFVNMAKHFLAEAMDKYGERPSILRRMAVVQIALGNVGTAQIYLRALEKVPFHSNWARNYLDRLQQNPTLKGDPLIDRLKELAPQENFVMPISQDQIFRRLLKQNPHNRMACEYLLSYYLLTNNLKALAAEIKRLEACGVTKIPRRYQEAMILTDKVLQLKIDDFDRYVTADTLRQFERFVELTKNNRADPAKTRQVLGKEFPGSYFSYYFLTLNQ